MGESQESRSRGLKRFLFHSLGILTHRLDGNGGRKE
jgi:hypothetical protein